MSDLPAPLVSADVDLRDFAFMPLDVVRLRDSDLAAEQSPDSCWAALLLWCASWHQVPAASIPDSDIWQAKQAGYVARGRIDPAWETVRDGALSNWIRCSDGRLYHPVVAEKALAAWSEKLARKQRTANATAAREAKARAEQELRDAERDEQRDETRDEKRGGKRDGKRHGRNKSHLREGTGKGQGQGEGQGQGQGVINPSVVVPIVGGSQAPAQAPPPTPPPAPAPPKTDPPPSGGAVERGQRMPKDWLLPQKWGEWALAKYPRWSADKVRDEALKFRNHWAAKTGKDATKLDWFMTWQNWCMSDIAHKDDPRPASNAAAEPAWRVEQRERHTAFAGPAAASAARQPAIIDLDEVSHAPAIGLD